MQFGLSLKISRSHFSQISLETRDYLFRMTPGRFDAFDTRLRQAKPSDFAYCVSGNWFKVSNY